MNKSTSIVMNDGNCFEIEIHIQTKKPLQIPASTKIYPGVPHIKTTTIDD